MPTTVYADEKRLRQILINLLANAIKFTHSGGVAFIIRYRSPVAEFEIVDTGPGIQTSDLERIFAPFERGALGAAQPHTGTGLGLTISKLLAGVMGGAITVSSTVGKGSSFRVTLLLSEVAQPSRSAPLQAPIFGYHGPRKTILVTDDDPAHSDLMREVLAPLGFILLSAPNGAERAWSWLNIVRRISSFSTFRWRTSTAGARQDASRARAPTRQDPDGVGQRSPTRVLLGEGVAMKAETTRRPLLPAWASALRMKWTRQRYQLAYGDLGDRRLDAFVRVGDDELHPAQAPPAQLA